MDINDVAVALQNLNQLLGRLIAQTALSTVIPISQGGTGATTAGQALANLGAMSTTIALSANGMAGEPPFRLIDFRNANGTALAAAAAAGVFGISVTAGTSMFLVTEAANANTKTDTAIVEYVLPPNYIAGQNLTITANANYVLGTGTLGTHTLAIAAYSTTLSGLQGANLVSTAAQNLPAAAGALTYAVDGSGLSPNGRLLLVATIVLQETGGTGNITARINSMRIG